MAGPSAFQIIPPSTASQFATQRRNFVTSLTNYNAADVNNLPYQLAMLREQLTNFTSADLTYYSKGVTHGDLTISVAAPDMTNFNALKPSKPTDGLLNPNIPGPVSRPTFISPTLPPTTVSIPPWLAGELSINIAGLPDPDVPEFTNSIPVISYPNIPVMEEFTIPDDPIISPITIPSLESADFPYFDDVMPEVNLLAPSIDISSGDNTHDSIINDYVRDWLANGLLNGGTGLADDVEDSIFRRESERALQTHNDRLIKLRSDWSKGHFPLPTSMLLSMISEAENDFTNKRLDTSRDISIKQAELAQANTHFFVQQALAYEQQIIGWLNSVANRVMEASKSTAQMNVELYRADIQHYNLLVDIYKANVQAYESLVSVAVKKLEAQRIALDQARLIGDINKTAVEVYRAQLESLMVFVNKYRAEMEGAKTYLEIENLKLSGFKTEVDAFATRVTAAATGYNMYNTRLEGEKARIQAYSAGADAYYKRVQAAKVEVDAQGAILSAQGAYNKSLAEIFTADISGFDAKIKAEVARITAIAKAYETSMVGLTTEAKMQEIIDGLKIRRAELDIKAYHENFDADFRDIQFQVQQTLDRWKMRLQAYETVAQVTAQVAAAAMNSDSQTVHLSESQSYAESDSESHQYYKDETTPT